MESALVSLSADRRYPTAKPSSATARREGRFFRAVLHAPAPVMLFDDAGRVVLCSHAWLAAMGCGQANMRRIEDVAARARPGHSRVALTFLRNVIDTEPVNQTADFSFGGRGGAARDWSLVASALGPLPDSTRLFICIGNDVTERKRWAARTQENERRFRRLLEAVPAAIYTTDAEGRITFYNEAAADLWGRHPQLGSLWCGSWRLYWPDGRAMAHDECPMAVALKKNRIIRGAEVMAERPDGTRISFIPYPTPLHDGNGKLVGAVNMLVDITASKQVEKRLGMLAREVDHRAKNMLAVIQGMVHFTHAETAHDFALAIEGRIMALGRAHSMLSENEWKGVDLKQLLEDELAPHERFAPSRVSIDGESLLLGPATAQSVAMMLHELAMNAATFGALREGGGHVRVSWARDARGVVHLQWKESGCCLVRPPARRGFGLNLIERTLCDQMDGAAKFDWLSAGLVCQLQIPTHQSERIPAIH